MEKIIQDKPAELFRPDHLLEKAIQKLKDLGNGLEASTLFPDGIEAFNLEVITNNDTNEFRLSITAKESTGHTNGALSLQSDDDVVPFFNAEGHTIIALIAKMDLEANQPECHEKVMAILNAGDRTWEEAALFPDEIRQKQPETKPWHFVDIPFKDGDTMPNPALPPAPHVLTKIDEFTTTLTQGNGTDQEKVDAISWIFHLFGDVHQPLHCISHFSKLHPDGDRGGNSFKLKGGAKNLHSAWDSSVNVLEKGKGNEDLATEIMELHTREELEADLAETNTEKWARASFKLAKTNAYSIKENPSNAPKLSAAYLKNMQAIGRKQAALAGYRLADRLQQIFP